MGRPSLYTPELVEAIAARLATGEPLASICRDDGMPHPSTVRDWMAQREDVSLVIARAREDGFDAIAVEALRIADECRVGEKVKTNADGQVIEKQTGDMVERSRLQIDTRLKLLAKWDPKRYGDKLITENTNHTTVELVDTDEMDRRLDRAIAAACAAGSAVDAKPG